MMPVPSFRHELVGGVVLVKLDGVGPGADVAPHEGKGRAVAQILLLLLQCAGSEGAC